MLLKAFRWTQILVAASCVAFLTVDSARATDFFVDAGSGSDATGDGSSGNPWKTITHALTLVGNGDRILVRPGTYDQANGESFPLQPVPGTSLISTGGPGVTTISAAGAGPGIAAVQFAAGQTFGAGDRLEGFRITGGFNGVEVLATGQTTAPTIHGNTITGNQNAGVSSYSLNFASRAMPTIQSNTISGNQHGVRALSSYYAYVDPVIRDNDIEGNNGYGFYGFGVTAGYQYPTFDSNRIRGNGKAGIYFQTFVSSRMTPTLTNNTISGNDRGIQIFAYYGSITPGSTHDTIAYNAKEGIRVQQQYGYVTPAIWNGIIWGNGTTDLVGLPSASVFYCDVGTGLPGGGFANQSVPPGFVDGPGGDFHLQAASPLLDQGSQTPPTLPATDFEGQTRAIDGDGDTFAFPDMGADEHLPRPRLRLNGTPQTGSPVSFTVLVTGSLENGNIAFVLLSATGDGSVTGGLPLPGGNGLILGIDSDFLTNIGLSLLPLFTTAAISGSPNGSANSPTFPMPAAPPGLNVWAAAVTFVPAPPAYSQTTATIQFQTQ
ncbi:MAG: right-handed parallel beta-helix repeat-containing protein [Planctomycetota bacterium]